MQVVNRRMKRYSTSIIIMEMQVKITTRYHFTPVRMAIIKKNTNNKSGEDTKKGNPHTLVARVQIGTVIVEKRIEVSQKLKTELPYDPANL